MTFKEATPIIATVFAIAVGVTQSPIAAAAFFQWVVFVIAIKIIEAKENPDLIGIRKEVAELKSNMERVLLKGVR